MDTTSSVTQLVKSISVLDAVICIAEAAKQVSPQTVQRYSQEARFSTESTGDNTDEINIYNSRSLSIWLHMTMLKQKIALTLIQR